MPSLDYTPTDIAARSVELAERALRLAEQKESSESETKLTQAADELVKLDKQDRFYAAQTLLETDPRWSEGIRSIAHEMNQMDEILYDFRPLSFDDSLNMLKAWANLYIAAEDAEVKKYGKTVWDRLTSYAGTPSSNDTDEKLAGFKTLLQTIEEMLVSAHDTIDKTTIDPRVRTLRAMRDSFLVQRELSVDLETLVKQEVQDEYMDSRIAAARSAVAKIYDLMATNQLPR